MFSVLVVVLFPYLQLSSASRIGDERDGLQELLRPARPSEDVDADADHAADAEDVKDIADAEDGEDAKGESGPGPHHDEHDHEGHNHHPSDLWKDPECHCFISNEEVKPPGQKSGGLDTKRDFHPDASTLTWSPGPAPKGKARDHFECQNMCKKGDMYDDYKVHGARFGPLPKGNYCSADPTHKNHWVHVSCKRFKRHR